MLQMVINAISASDIRIRNKINHIKCLFSEGNLGRNEIWTVHLQLTQQNAHINLYSDIEKKL